MNLKDTYSKISRDWVKDHSQDSWWQKGTDQFLSLLPANATILDLGCGGGVKTKYISDKGYDVEGADFSEGMIEVAKERNPKIEFSVHDIYEIDTYSKYFDGIFAQAVLLHIEKKRMKEVLEKLKDRLNIGGLLYVAVKGIKEGQSEEGVVIENDYGYGYERFFSYFALDELQKYFTEVGLELVLGEVERTGKTDWIQIVGRKIA